MMQLWDVAASGEHLVEAGRVSTGCNTMCRCAPCPGGSEERPLVAMPQACDGVDTGVSSELDVWDLRSNKVACQTGIGDDGSNHGMCMSLTMTGAPGESDAMLVRGCEDGSVGIFDLTAGRWRFSALTSVVTQTLTLILMEGQTLSCTKKLSSLLPWWPKIDGASLDLQTELFQPSLSIWEVLTMEPSVNVRLLLTSGKRG